MKRKTEATMTCPFRQKKKRKKNNSKTPSCDKTSVATANPFPLPIIST